MTQMADGGSCRGWWFIWLNACGGASQLVLTQMACMHTSGIIQAAAGPVPSSGVQCNDHAPWLAAVCARGAAWHGMAVMLTMPWRWFSLAAAQAAALGAARR